MTPTLFHLFKGNISGHLRRKIADGFGDFFLVAQFIAGKPEGGQELVEVDPASVGVVITEGKLRFLAWHGQSFKKADPSIHPGQSSAAVFEAARNHFETKARPTLDMQTEQCGIQIGAQRVDVVKKEIFQMRPLRQQSSQDAIAQNIRDLVPMADRMEALERRVVRIIVRLACTARPMDQRVTQAIAHFLLLFVKHLLRHLFP